MRLTPEQELLVCCARLELSPERSQRIHDLLAVGLDSDGLLGTARAHGVLPLLGRHLLREDSPPLPGPVRERLRGAVREIAARNAFLTAELVRVLGRLEAAGIMAVPFKGPVAALAAYGDIGLRQFADLDILVCREDLNAACRILGERGYQALYGFGRGQTAVFRRAVHHHSLVHPKSGVMIEVHWRFNPGSFHFPLDLSHLGQRLARVTVGGVDLPVLSLEDTLLVLCAHGARHLWTRLEWICLVRELVRRYDAIDWGALADRAASLSARHVVQLGLRLARDVLDAPLPPEASRRLGEDPAVGPLALDVSDRLFVAGNGCPRPWAEMTRVARTRECRRHRLLYVLRTVMEPSVTDLQLFEFPRGLGWLYYIERLARLAWKYGLAARFVASESRRPERGGKQAPWRL